MRGSLLAAALALLAVMLVVLVYTTHTASAHDEADPRTVWLKLHPPRQAHHDAELLRRRTLATIEALDDVELADHVPQLVACLGHHDAHVRELALRLLRRLPSSAMASHAETLVTVTLALISDDNAAKLFVLQALLAVAGESAGRLGPSTSVSHCGSSLAFADMPTVAAGRTAD